MNKVKMIIIKLTFGAALLCLALAANSVFSQPAAPSANAVSTNAPAGQRRGAPMSDADKAEVAAVADLPQWKHGDGDGDYFIGPNYPCPRKQ